MKKKVIFSIVAVALFAIAMAFSSQNSSALADTEPSVSCRCQWFGDGCRANGWGQRCATKTPCYTHDKDCG